MEFETYCALCGDRLANSLKAHELAENRVIKCGELSYIELAHRACAVADGDSGIPWEYDSEAVVAGKLEEARVAEMRREVFASIELRRARHLARKRKL